MKIPPRSKDARIQRRNRELKELKDLQEQVDSFVRAFDMCMLMARTKKMKSNCLRTCPFHNRRRRVLAIVRALAD